MLPILASLLPIASPAAGQQRENIIAIVNVSVVPMDRERVIPDQTVIVQGDRILAVSPAGNATIPASRGRRRLLR